MRILKVELQNINSLKSDTPIVIDYQDDKFNDIGLYAITGPTGAGKTTILDAITIALYHNVPRFNKSHIKAGLQDVVSYGASDALARVAFENNNQVFEAQWSMRVLSKTGKQLSKPDEQVRLKNINSGKIIAEKKSDFKNEVEKITQLNYNQFLRSVMLAQGEFAAFLSAKPSEKGTLLEQITGEEIYKKIGETLNFKISEERRKLKAIEAKVNNDDLLTADERKGLEQEKHSLTSEIEKLENELKQIEQIINWYTKNKELLLTKNKLEKEFEVLENSKKENQTIVDKLVLHEKAEPYKELINSIVTQELDIRKKEKKLVGIAEEIEKLSTKLESSEKKLEKNKQEHFKAETDYNDWIPKLEELAIFDADIENKKKLKAKTGSAIKLLKNSVLLFHENIRKAELLKKHKEKNLAGIKNYLDNDKMVLEIEKHLNKWNSILTVRKENRGKILKETELIKLKDKELIKARKDYKINEHNLEEEKIKLEILDNEINKLSEKLGLNKLEELLLRKDKADGQKSKWKELQNLSDNYIKLKKDEQKQFSEIANLEKTEKELEKLLKNLITEIETAKISLTDAEKILGLESKIKNFENERKKLIKGEACNLCGSTAHPFVEKYQKHEISKAKQQVTERKNILEQLNKDEKTAEINQSNTKTKLKQSNFRLTEINEEIQETKNTYNTLKLDCEINNPEKIADNLSNITAELNELSGKIIDVQNLQKQKDKKAKIYKQQSEAVSNLSNLKSSLTEKGKNLNNELDQRKKEADKLSFEIKQAEYEINKEFSGFELQMPLPEKTSGFIEGLHKRIKKFHIKKEELINTENTILQLVTEIKNNKTQLADRTKDTEILDSELSKLINEISAISAKRNSILPLRFSTEMKRKDLQNILDNTKKQLEIAINHYNKLDKDVNAIKNGKNNLENEKTEQFEKLKNNLTTLETEIEKSGFNTRKEIEEALLSHKNKTEFQEIRKRVENKEIELNTKQKQLTNNLEKLNEIKDFEISEEEIKTEHLEKKSIKDDLLKRTGEINSKFETDDKIRSRNKKVFDEFDKQKEILKKWDTLLNLLGGSKDAFNIYVQRLSLQNLIQLANIHLFKLNRRYSLQINETYKKGEELNFVLVDHYQTGQTRPIDTTSGGEKFLISLALALGLSDLASNNVKIDSLFIDEGFGTLDNNTLETVISTLETLQAQGKMIGIISHVENLKERIPTQIQVIKKSNGVSELLVV